MSSYQIPKLNTKLAGMKAWPRDTVWSNRLKAVPIPDVFDPRTYYSKQFGIPEDDVLLEPYDQEICGCCWAVASTGVLTDRFRIALLKNGNKDIKYLSLNSLSLTTCCNSNNGFDSAGCDGGYTSDAGLFFEKFGLPQVDTENKCVGWGDFCKDIVCETSAQLPKCDSDAFTGCSASFKAVPKSTQFLLHPNNNDIIEDMKHELFVNGPITGAMAVFADFEKYTGGIYIPKEPRVYIGGHAVEIIGWGKENDKYYWIVKNSWSKNWGINGYVHIIMRTSGTSIDIPAKVKNNDGGYDTYGGPVVWQVDLNSAKSGWEHPTIMALKEQQKRMGIFVILVILALFFLYKNRK